MTREKKKSRSFLSNPMDLLKAIGFAEEKSTAGFRLCLLVDTSLDPGLLAYAKESFRPVTDNLSISVIFYDKELPPFPLGSELAIIMAAEAPITGRLLISALRERVPTAVVTLDPVLLQRIARENGSEIDLLSIVTVADLSEKQERFQRLFQELGSWIARELSDGLLPLARALTFVRDPYVKNAIQAVSLQNAAIAAAFFVPGPDMPLLTLNQVRLFLQIATAYNAEIDSQRLKELVVLVISGLGLRGFARSFVKLVPIIGWAVRGAVAFTATLAIGKAAQKYFENGGNLMEALEGLKPIAIMKAMH